MKLALVSVHALPYSCLLVASWLGSAMRFILVNLVGSHQNVTIIRDVVSRALGGQLSLSERRVLA